MSRLHLDYSEINDTTNFGVVNYAILLRFNQRVLKRRSPPSIWIDGGLGTKEEPKEVPSCEVSSPQTSQLHKASKEYSSPTLMTPHFP